MERILRPSEFFERLGISEATGKRLKKSDPNFPRYVCISTQCRGVLESEADAYMRQLPRVGEADQTGEGAA
jgi:predicted DNA-binding transcriptional regulator AlpA